MLDVEFMRDFTNAIVRGGLDTYKKIVSDPASPCVDIRAHPGQQPVPVTLVKKMWDFVLPHGE